MKQITLQIEDSKIPFFIELIQNFDFVKVDDGDTDEEILKSIETGLKEIELIKKGKLKARPARELLNEL